jgi:CRP-like cAMP-binding protein
MAKNIGAAATSGTVPRGKPGSAPPPGFPRAEETRKAFAAGPLGALLPIARERRFAARHTVLREGDPSESFFLLLQGRVKMARALPTGRSLTLALFSDGDLFGTVAALGDRPCDASLVALEKCLCLEVQRRDLYALFEDQPSLVATLLPRLSQHLAECSNCLVELSCYKVEMRFAQMLLKLADAVGIPQPQGAGTLVPIPLSRQELADMTGTTIETCIRVMSRWQKEGVVQTRDDGFLLQDRRRLRPLAGL